MTGKPKRALLPALTWLSRFFQITTHAKTNSPKSKSIKITLLYCLVGTVWILFSDQLALFLFHEQSKYTAFSIAKGLFYVLVTAFLIYGLIYPPLKKAIDAQKRNEKINVELEASNALYKRLCQEFDEEQALLTSLFDSIPDLIFYKNISGVYLGCNKAFEVFAGKPQQEIVGRTDFDLFDPESAERWESLDQETIRTSTAQKFDELITDSKGSRIYFETVETPYYDSGGNIIGLIGISRDISERKKREEEIQYLNYHDVLTGIYNRAFFQEQQKALDTEEQLPLSIIVGDVNGLKLINDAMGHALGDKLLRKIAAILSQCIRPEDVLARMGGDEFSILLPKTDGDTAWAIIERINAVCAESAGEEESAVFHTNIALGYATKVEMEESLDAVIRSAEEFMYRRKLLEYKSLHSSILASIKTTMFEKCDETEEHAQRLAELSKKLGLILGLSNEDIMKLELVSALHDIGTISIDKDILTKPGDLNDEEWREIKKHPAVGFRIANATPELRHVSEYILSHHERWDGTGYPQGLSKEEIPLISRIISIVDAFDAMTADRSYRKALSPETATAEIINNAGAQFDPKLAAAFVDAVIEKEKSQ